MIKRVTKGDRLYAPCPHFWGRINAYEVVRVGTGHAEVKRWDDVDEKGFPIGAAVGYELTLHQMGKMSRSPKDAAREAVSQITAHIAELSGEVEARKADLESLEAKRGKLPADSLWGDE